MNGLSIHVLVPVRRRGCPDGRLRTIRGDPRPSDPRSSAFPSVPTSHRQSVHPDPVQR
jgi:hypothetical protein